MAKFLSVPGLIVIGSLTACTDPVVGDWEMQATTTEGSYQAYDYNYSEYINCSYSVTEVAELSIGEDLSAELDGDFEVDGSCYGSSQGGYQLEGIITPSGDGSYELDLEDGDGNEFEFDCEMNADQSELSCDLDGTEYVFEKK